MSSFLTPAAFEDDHKLVESAQPQAQETTEEAHTEAKDDGGLTVPSGTGIKEFMQWVEGLPEREPPTYLGLPGNAEKLLLVGHGRGTIENLKRITGILEEGEELEGETAKKALEG